MISKEITIRLENGLEARPVAMLVQVASQFDSSIYLEAGEKKVNAKSIMGVMALASQDSPKIKIYADGEGEEEAVKKIASLLG